MKVNHIKVQWFTEYTVWADLPTTVSFLLDWS